MQLLLLTVAGLVQWACADPLRYRKSMGFGPVHKHAVYRTMPKQLVAGRSTRPPISDTFEVARSFVETIHDDHLSDTNTYTIRKDSYTDATTGVTHVYVRQVVDGLEVSDGDMNINIKDGEVLSYGNSFFPGSPAPHSARSALPEDMRHPHQDFCDGLTNQLTIYKSMLASDSTVSATPSTSGEEGLEHLEHLHRSNCPFQHLPNSTTVNTGADVEPYAAAILHFMVAATPNAAVADDIIRNFETHALKIAASSEGRRRRADTTHFMLDNVPDTVNPVKAKLAYIQVPGKNGDSVHLTLVWKFEVEMQDNWYETAVSAAAPHRIISVVDWASDAPSPIADAGNIATYDVYRLGVNDPSTGNRTIEWENFDVLASPIGWHSVPFDNDPSFRGVELSTQEFYRNTTTTWGNNVFAQENWLGLPNTFLTNYRPDAGPSKVFDYSYAPNVTNASDALEEAQKYINATVAQLFYTTNMVHDLYYRYGFDEVSGNFQQYNFGRGGQGDDAIVADAQYGFLFGTGTNDNFMTPPDGQNGRMRMYLWNTAIPYRDGDFEAGIVIHELSHGLSTRLTGGPANSGCLPFGESGGMGEGWGDFLATTIRSTANYSDYAMGSWAANRVQGIRNYPYSLNETINPSTYKTLDKPGYFGVHAIGEVWAQILWVVSEGLIEKHGFADTLYPPAPLKDGSVPTGDFYRPASGKKPLVPKHGNSLIFQLVLNAMKLQPCRPGFFEARDAIILADQQLTGGENFCTLWKGFSAKGLGPDANVVLRTPWGGGVRTDDFEVPNTCMHDP